MYKDGCRYEKRQQVHQDHDKVEQKGTPRGVLYALGRLLSAPAPRGEGGGDVNIPSPELKEERRKTQRTRTGNKEEG